MTTQKFQPNPIEKTPTDVRVAIQPDCEGGFSLGSVQREPRFFHLNPIREIPESESAVSS